MLKIGYPWIVIQGIVDKTVAKKCRPWSDASYMVRDLLAMRCLLKLFCSNI